MCFGALPEATRRPLLGTRVTHNAGVMTTTNQPPLTDEVQRARGILAELAEAGTTLLTRERHLDVLLALDNLEASSRGAWPPPRAPQGVSSVDDALREAKCSLDAVLGDLTRHGVEALPVAFAIDHVRQALGRRA